ncbi:hypothetical protein HBI29_121950 [Parastagonospora nodorum]|nr:hypothetical protein HBI29_121950 [Parastagonospora nodorum]
MRPEIIVSVSAQERWSEIWMCLGCPITTAVSSQHASPCAMGLATAMLISLSLGPRICSLRVGSHRAAQGTPSSFAWKRYRLPLPVPLQMALPECRHWPGAKSGEDGPPVTKRRSVVYQT